MNTQIKSKYRMQSNCWRNFFIICLLTCITSCVRGLKGSSYAASSKSIETNIMISVSCPAELMDQLVQSCVSVQAPQHLKMNHIVPLHSSSQFQLSYNSIYTSNLNRILTLLDENSRVKYSVSKLPFPYSRQ